MSTQMQNTFKALADPTRRQILMHLSNGSMTIGELADEFPITRAAIKKHLNMLEQGDLISVHVEGRECINQLEPDGLAGVQEWLSYFDQFWDQKLSALHKAISDQ